MNTMPLLPAIVLCLCVSAQVQAQTAIATKSALVSAHVIDTCKFSSPTTSLALNLGALDPSLGVPKTETGSIGFSCTNGYTIQVGIAGQTAPALPGPGVSRQLTHSADPTKTLPYTLTLALPDGSTGRGFGPGNQLTLNLTTEVQPEAYLDAVGGSYEETLLVELRP